MPKGRPARAALFFPSLRDGRAVALEEGKFFQIDDVLAVGGFALGEDGHTADDLAAGVFDQRFQRAQRFAGGDDVVDDDHALALHVLGVVAVITLLVAFGYTMAATVILAVTAIITGLVRLILQDRSPWKVRSVAFDSFIGIALGIGLLITYFSFFGLFGNIFFR